MDDFNTVIAAIDECPPKRNISNALTRNNVLAEKIQLLSDEQLISYFLNQKKLSNNYRLNIAYEFLIASIEERRDISFMFNDKLPQFLQDIQPSVKELI